MKKTRVMGAIPTTTDGIRFHSRREARRYSDLKMLERGRQISDLELQYKIPLVVGGIPILTEPGRQMVYIADFRYFDHVTMQTVIEDAKGHETDIFKLKRSILKAMGIVILVT